MDLPNLTDEVIALKEKLGSLDWLINLNIKSLSSPEEIHVIIETENSKRIQLLEERLDNGMELRRKSEEVLNKKVSNLKAWKIVQQKALIDKGYQTLNGVLEKLVRLEEWKEEHLKNVIFGLVHEPAFKKFKIENNKRIQLLEETVTANNGFIEERVSDSAQHELQIKALEDWREEHVSNEITFKRMEYKRIQSLEDQIKINGKTIKALFNEIGKNQKDIKVNFKCISLNGVERKKNRAVLRELITCTLIGKYPKGEDEFMLEKRLLSQLSEPESPYPHGFKTSMKELEEMGEPQPSYPSLDGSLDPLTGQPSYLVDIGKECPTCKFDGREIDFPIFPCLECDDGLSNYKEEEPQPDIDLDPLELFWKHKEQYIHKDELRAAFNKLIKIINEKSFNKDRSTLNNPTPLYVIGRGDMKRELKEALEGLLEGSKK